LGQRDSDDAKRRAMRLREILFECGVDWLEFLMAINPNGAEGLLKYWFAI